MLRYARPCTPGTSGLTGALLGYGATTTTQLSAFQRNGVLRNDALPSLSGGRTDTDDLVTLCAYHHHEVPSKRWSVSGDANVELSFVGPGGRTLTHAPRRCGARSATCPQRGRHRVPLRLDRGPSRARPAAAVRHRSPRAQSSCLHQCQPPSGWLSRGPLARSNRSGRRWRRVRRRAG